MLAKENTFGSVMGEQSLVRDATINVLDMASVGWHDMVVCL